jgi:hypothetical protein
MSEAQKIIGELYERGMSFTSIGACIGRSREAISRAYYGHNSGSRMLPRLRQLYHFVEDVGPGYDQGVPGYGLSLVFVRKATTVR